jgi:hypothetical protein
VRDEFSDVVSIIPASLTLVPFYNKIERGVASKKLKDLWRETPVMASTTPSIEHRYGTSGYG